MRKSIVSALLFLSTTALFFISCQKEASQDSSNKEIIAKVNSWLDSKKPVNKTIQSANVELLKNNLDFSRLRIEQSEHDEKIIIIPVSEGLKTEKNIDKKAIPNLVLILDKSGNIRKGNLVLYIPESGQAYDRVPDNTFYEILNTGKPDCGGKFRYLSVTGKWLHELEYQNERLKSFSTLKNPSTNGMAGRSCTEWYWVTTYYDADGMQIDQTWDYIGTTCQGGDCQDPYFEMICPVDNNGSGGGTLLTEEFEFEVNRTVDWNVAVNPNPLENGVGEIKSVETIKGKRNSSEPQGGHFEKITHNWSSCNFCSSNEPFNVWLETSNSVSASGQSASSTVTGDLNYDGVSYPGITKTKTWSFLELFP